MTWKRALVTGASSGIGREIANQLADAGTDLVIVARDERRLNELKASLDVDVKVLLADLGDPAQLARVETRIASNIEPIDLLVNNAGFGNTGDFWDLDVDAEAAVLNVNCLALMRLSHAAATAMRDRCELGRCLCAIGPWHNIWRLESLRQ